VPQTQNHPNREPPGFGNQYQNACRAYQSRRPGDEKVPDLPENALEIELVIAEAFFIGSD
jgi:hypothetical protein